MIQWRFGIALGILLLLAVPVRAANSVSNVRVSIGRGDPKSIAVRYDFSYSSTTPLLVRTSLILYDTKGLIINKDVFAKGSFSREVPAGTDNAYDTGGGYVNASEVSRAVKADVQWDIIEKGSQKVLANGTQKFSTIPSSQGASSSAGGTTGGTGSGTASSGTGGTGQTGTSAATDCTSGSASFVNGQFCNTLFGENVTASQYFANFYRWAVGIAILGAAIAIVFAGYKYAMSKGNPSEISSAKEIIISAIMGLVLLLLSFTIVRFLGINVG